MGTALYTEPEPNGHRSQPTRGRLAHLVDARESTRVFARLARALEDRRFLEAAEARNQLEALGFTGLLWQPRRRLS